METASETPEGHVVEDRTPHCVLGGRQTSSTAEDHTPQPGLGGRQTSSTATVQLQQRDAVFKTPFLPGSSGTTSATHTSQRSRPTVPSSVPANLRHQSTSSGAHQTNRSTSSGAHQTNRSTSSGAHQTSRSPSSGAHQIVRSTSSSGAHRMSRSTSQAPGSTATGSHTRSASRPPNSTPRSFMQTQGAYFTGASASSSRAGGSTARPRSTPRTTPRSTPRPPSATQARYNVFGAATTPRTPASSTNTGTTSGSGRREPLVLMAIVEGRGQAQREIGIASMDLRHPELRLTQFTDYSSYSRLNIKLTTLNPVEIILPDTAIMNSTSLHIAILAELPAANITPAARRTFNEQRGAELIERLRVDECSTVTRDLSENKYYCLACASALLQHIETIQNTIFAPRSVKVTYESIDSACLIDPSTARALELITSSRDQRDTKHSLYGVLGTTLHTNAGARLLRAALLQPYTDVSYIKMRQDALDELTRNEEGYHNLRNLIGRMRDIENVIGLCVHIDKTTNHASAQSLKMADYKIGQAIALKHTLDYVPALQDLTKNFKSDLFQLFHQSFTPNGCGEISDLILAVIHENVQYQPGALNMRLQKCYAIKPDVKGLLDIQRQVLNELLNDANEESQRVIETSQLPFKQQYSSSRGFYLSLYVRSDQVLNVEDVMKAGEFESQSWKGNTMTCLTRRLMQVNDRITELVNDIHRINNIVLNELFAAIRQYIGRLYTLADIISHLDVLLSLTHVCTMNAYVRPEFGDVLALKSSRHPILQGSDVDCDPVPNDTFISMENSFLIITGPNMMGKSTYLKQIMLLQIMAQAGSFVPADYAVFRVCNRLYSRFDHNDQMQENSSSFMVEMKDMSFILQGLESKPSQALVVIDELGRNTACDEGYTMCHSICEHLIKMGAFTIFATHYLDLAYLDTLYINVENYHFGNAGKHDEARHVLRKGPYRGPVYGFDIAEMARFPQEVLQDAKEMFGEIQKKKYETHRDVMRDGDFLRKRADFRLAMRLIQAAKCDDMDEPTLARFFAMLNTEFVADTAHAQRVDLDMAVVRLCSEGMEDTTQGGDTVASGGDESVAVGSGGDESVAVEGGGDESVAVEGGGDDSVAVEDAGWMENFRGPIDDDDDIVTRL